MTVELEPRVGTITGPRPVIEAFLAGIRDGWPSVEAARQEDLRAAGVIDADGRAVPPLRRLEATLRDPAAPALTLTGSGRRMLGRVGRTVGIVLTVPDADDRSTLLPVHSTLMPKAIARAVRLRSVPTPSQPMAWSELLENLPAARVWTLTLGDESSPRFSLTVADSSRGMYEAAGDTAQPSSSAAIYRAVAAAIASVRPHAC